MTNISKLAWTGVAREASPGSAASTPTLYIPVKKSTWTRKTKIVYQSEERATRDGNNRRVPTVRMTNGELSGDIYIDTIPYILLGFMGGVTSTQPDSLNAPTAYSHAHILADVPPGLTFFKGLDHTGLSMAYSAISKLKIKFDANAKLLEFDASVESQYGTKLTGGTFTAMVPTYGDIQAFAGYAPIIKIDTVEYDLIENMEIDLEQKIELSYTARGNRGFYKIDYGERTAKINFQARFDTFGLEDDFDAEADHALEITFTGANLGGAIVEKIDLNFPIIGYDEVDIDQSKPAQSAKVKATARPGSTKNSLFTATVVNEIASYAS